MQSVKLQRIQGITGDTNKLLLVARIGQKKLATFILDSGSDKNLLTLNAAHRLKLELPENGTPIDIKDLDGTITKGVPATINLMELQTDEGGYAVRGLPVVVANVLENEPMIAGILGMQFLSMLKAKVDFEDATLHIGE